MEVRSRSVKGGEMQGWMVGVSEKDFERVTLSVREEGGEEGSQGRTRVGECRARAGDGQERLCKRERIREREGKGKGKRESESERGSDERSKKERSESSYGAPWAG